MKKLTIMLALALLSMGAFADPITWHTVTIAKQIPCPSKADHTLLLSFTKGENFRFENG